MFVQFDSLAKITPSFLILLVSLLSCKNQEKTQNNPAPSTGGIMHYPEEKHFKNMKQLTFGGNNAEAYWSFDGQKLTFQSDFKNWGADCDQIFWFRPFQDDLKSVVPNYISKKKGRTTCSYFMPGDSTILFASTCGNGENCPIVPERKPGGKYVWPIYNSYEIYISDLNGNVVEQLTNNEFYDAEGTISPLGDMMVFTSNRSGDLELHTMNLKTKEIKQITSGIGYDGGAFFSPDGKKIVFRASRPQTDQEKMEYFELLKNEQVQPTNMEIYTCNIDGTYLQQITKLGKANWAPFFTPDGKKIIFSSNHAANRGFQFNLYMINTDGTGLEKVSHDVTFDSFPMFSPDGKYLVFSSNRNNGGTRDTNLFLAEWAD
jgi:TolB protein